MWHAFLCALRDCRQPAHYRFHGARQRVPYDAARDLTRFFTRHKPTP